MNLYTAGTIVTLSIPLVDKAGNALSVTAISYRLTLGDGTEILATSSLGSFTSGDDTATVVIDGSLNVLTTGNVRESRRAELFLTLDDTNQVALDVSYAISAMDGLIIGGNTFQSLADAQLTVLSIANMNAWNVADERAQETALIEARHHIVQLNFYLMNAQNLLDQSNLQYFPDVPWATLEGVFVFNGNLTLLTPAQYIALPTRFKTALNLAQVAEANSILGGDEVGDSRRIGLVSNTIGEAKQVYRQGRPLDLPVCRQALSYLSLYVTFAKRIGRA